MSWQEIQEGVKRCKRCKEEGFDGVKCPDDRIPTVEPRPRGVRILFISEAPPLNSQYYFYYENTNDRLRNSLFELLRSAMSCESEHGISTISDFIDAGFFLLPTVKCPTARDGRNAAPSAGVIKLCAERHLKREIEYIKPEGVCLLGRTALHGFLTLLNHWGMSGSSASSLKGGRSLSSVAGKVLEVEISGRSTRFMISYWPTRRHRKFNEICEHIRLLYEM